ncbi:tryptophan-rich sensory protein [Sphingomonas paeninsulae]|jgi:benzodiazapine receptor|uniref:Tryptophan-rich sensory protein n=1 Tax=Sphingomonas paeninsulae TaxID=2319844 RepID=A0A494TLG9_SPHPE|nr:TspO/MBR family protein [Sphingomonas paeninsulae]AYJ85965.1 tryptophan-rich sensory protein [Sphingomonas paeninsulae]
MGELASRDQLRMSFVRWVLFTVPLLVFLGFLSGRVAGSSAGNRWFEALVRPAAMPPGWAFGAAWTVLYILMGIALAMILNARRARFRGPAIALFVLQFIANLAWSPLFFAAHQVVVSFVLILLIFALAVATTFAFGRVRAAAAWLMVPYLAWLCFASILNWQVHSLNPNAETLVPARPHTQIEL